MADKESAPTGSSVGTKKGDPGEELQSSQGQTSIADGVVTKVAGLAAGEVAGVHELGGAASRAVGGLTQKVGLGDSRSQGVSVEVGDKEAAETAVSIENNRDGKKMVESLTNATEWLRAKIKERANI